MNAGAEASRWQDALLAADLLAVDPAGLGGVNLRTRPGPARDAWLDQLRGALPSGTPWRKLPLAVADARLLGGLDLAATLRAGRPVAQTGLLAEADGGLVLPAMAERISAATAARLAAVLDTAMVSVARDGIAQNQPARIGLICLDEGLADDERPPAALLDRMAFLLDLDGIAWQAADTDDPDPDAIAQARARLSGVEVAEAILDAICDTATALGVNSLRAASHALRAARAAAALAGRRAAAMEDAALACRLVLAPRATRLPEEASAPSPPEAPEPPSDRSEERPTDTDPADAPSPPLDLGELLLAATRAAIPPGLLDQLRAQQNARLRGQSAGRAGAMQASRLRGRPAGIRAGDLRDGARLNVIETLRAAAPWQRLRRAERPAAPDRLQIRREDFRVTRLQQRRGATTIFVVDASGSAAANRLAEAKGAVELLLAECYVRRDQVAVIAFRGAGAQILLPPTRSLVRAKRSLASLPGGGGTPLAAGLDAAGAMAEAIQRRGETPAIVVLTDGRANIARDGAGGRARAAGDALDAARALRAGGHVSLVIDTSVRPQAEGARLALEMGARYLPLPYANAGSLSAAVRDAL